VGVQSFTCSWIEGVREAKENMGCSWGKSGNGAEKPAIYGHSMGNMSINQLIWDM
jgi:hypothetical protein